MEREEPILHNKDSAYKFCATQPTYVLGSSIHTSKEGFARNKQDQQSLFQEWTILL